MDDAELEAQAMAIALLDADDFDEGWEDRTAGRIVALAKAYAASLGDVG